VLAVGVVDTVQLRLVAKVYARAVTFMAAAPPRSETILSANDEVVAEPTLVDRVSCRKFRCRRRLGC